MRFVDIVGPPARGFLGLGGYWEDVVRCCQQAISSAKALNDLAKLARYTSNLGLAISRKYGRTGQVAATLYQMGAVAYDKQDEDLAEQYYRESLQLVQQLGDARLECRILNGLANIATVRQEFDTGRDYLVRSLDLAYQLGDVLQIAHAIMDQAFLEEWAEEYQKSFELSEEALPLLIQLQSPLAERLSRLRQRVLEKLSRQ
jgi:tetratricopeptide (TPR) repeat protein